MQSNPSQKLSLDLYSKCVLTAIAVLLGVIVLQHLTHPGTAAAAPNSGYLYIEPRTTMLRNPDGSQQVQGKVVIDMRTGDIWGFPTLSGTPYPVDTTRSEPPVSAPMYLGKFDFAKMTLQGAPSKP
jgi:hypothetical protein